MSGLYVRAVLAGAVFGAWPLVMRYSGLSGNAAAIAYASFSLACMIVYVVATGGMDIATAGWIYAVGAGALGAVGLLLFGNGLMQAPKTVVPYFIVTMVCMQIAVPALYQLVVNQEISARKLFGFGAAMLAVYLLSS